MAQVCGRCIADNLKALQSPVWTCQDGQRCLVRAIITEYMQLEAHLHRHWQCLMTPRALSVSDRCPAPDTGCYSHETEAFRHRCTRVHRRVIKVHE